MAREVPTWEEVAVQDHGTIEYCTSSDRPIYRVVWKQPRNDKAEFTYVGLGRRKAEAADMAIRIANRGL